MRGFFARWFPFFGLGRGSVSFGLGTQPSGPPPPPVYVDVAMGAVAMDGAVSIAVTMDSDASFGVTMDSSLTVDARTFGL